MIDLRKKNAANLIFIQITTAEPSPERSNLIREFCSRFWDQLSDEHRAAYVKCYVNPEFPDDSSERAQLAGNAAYDRGMTIQERETFY